MDERDVQTWVVVELTRAGEIRAGDGTLVEGLREALDGEEDHPVFVPAVTYTKGDDKLTTFLMEGYAFIGSGLEETSYFKMERDCPLVASILTTKGPNGMRVLQTLPGKKVAELRQQLREKVASDIITGMHVNIVAGTYASLSGDVMDTDLDHAYVHIGRPILHSIEILVRLPKVFLDPDDLIAGGDLTPNNVAELEKAAEAAEVYSTQEEEQADRDVLSMTAIGDFLRPLLVVLGEKSGFQPEVAVDMESVLDAVIQRAGLEPKALSQEEIAHAHRRIGFAFRNRRAKHCRKVTPLTYQVGRGLWALTEAGVEVARQLQQDFYS